MAHAPLSPWIRPIYRSMRLGGGNFCPGSAPNGQVTQPVDGSKTQGRRAHIMRMKATGEWDSKTTPAEDPARPGYRVRPSKWDAARGVYVAVS